MDRGFIRIAHLADLHFTAYNKGEDHYGQLCSDLENKIEPRPDLIVVTGDIADNKRLKDIFKNLRKWKWSEAINSLIFLFRKEPQLTKSLNDAKEFLESVCNKLGLDPNNRLYVVPGNHDYRYGGIGVNDSTIFNDIFRNYFQTKYVDVDGIDIIVGCFDSNTTKRKINFANGQVLAREFIKYNEFITTLLGDSYHKAKKTALLHHHPMPIFRAEVPGKPLDWEGFHLLENSATFMREMIKAGVRLIFHGHKHHRGVSKAALPPDLDIPRPIGVISAGSVGQTQDSDYSYNVVDFYNDGRVTVEFRVLRGAGSYDPELEKPIELFSQEEARAQVFHDLKSLARTTAKKETIFYKISMPGGDSEAHTIIEGLVAKRGTEKELPYILESKGGLFKEKPVEFNPRHPPIQTITWNRKGPPKGGVQNGFMTFDPPLSDSPITTDIYRVLPNAFEFTKEERKALANKETEELGLSLINILPEQQNYYIKFPDDFTPINPGVVVRDNVTDNISIKETEYCSQKMHYSKVSNILSLQINYPLLQHSYIIKWDLPPFKDFWQKIYENIGLSDNEIGMVEDIIKKFNSLSQDDSDRSKINNCLKEIYNEIINLILPSLKIPSTQDEPIEISLAFYDTKIYKLRYVAFFCPNCPDPSDSFWKKEIISGQFASGLAWKRVEDTFEFYPRGPTRIAAQYIRKPCKSAKNSYFTAIVAIPLCFPVTSPNKVAILELASCSNTSALLGLGGKRRHEKLEEIRVRQGTFRDLLISKFFEKILQAIDADEKTLNRLRQDLDRKLEPGG